jgi:hypothetical protein
MYAAALAVPLLMLIGLLLMQRLEEALLADSSRPAPPDREAPVETVAPAPAVPAQEPVFGEFTVSGEPAPGGAEPEVAAVALEEPAGVIAGAREPEGVTASPGSCGALAARPRTAGVGLGGGRLACTGRRRPAPHRHPTH